MNVNSRDEFLRKIAWKIFPFRCRKFDATSSSSSCSWFKWFEFNNWQICNSCPTKLSIFRACFLLTLLCNHTDCLRVSSTERNSISIELIRFRSFKQLRYLNSLDIFGVVDDRGLQKLHSLLGPSIQLNQQRFSCVARPTYGLRRTSIWGLRTRPWENCFLFFVVNNVFLFLK